MSYETTVDPDIFVCAELRSGNARKKKRQREIEERVQALRDADITFEHVRGNECLEMKNGFGNQVRFWPSTERWTVRFNSYRGFGDRGVQKLIEYLQKTRKLIGE
jgi:hypothetical protein